MFCPTKNLDWFTWQQAAFYLLIIVFFKKNIFFLVDGFFLRDAQTERWCKILIIREIYAGRPEGKAEFQTQL